MNFWQGRPITRIMPSLPVPSRPDRRLSDADLSGSNLALGPDSLAAPSADGPGQRAPVIR